MTILGNGVMNHSALLPSIRQDIVVRPVFDCWMYRNYSPGASQKRNSCRNYHTEKLFFRKTGLTAFFPCLPAASLQHSDKDGFAAFPFVFTLVPGKPVSTIKRHHFFLSKGLARKCSLFPCLPAGSSQKRNP